MIYYTCAVCPWYYSNKCWVNNYITVQRTNTLLKIGLLWPKVSETFYLHSCLGGLYSIPKTEFIFDILHHGKCKSPPCFANLFCSQQTLMLSYKKMVPYSRLLFTRIHTHTHTPHCKREKFPLQPKGACIVISFNIFIKIPCVILPEWIIVKPLFCTYGAEKKRKKIVPAILLSYFQF